MIYEDLTVFVRDGWSRVVRMPEPGVVGAVRRGKDWEAVWSDPVPDPAAEGWTPVKKGVRNQVEGWAYAALNHASLPADYDNPLKARPIARPTTLYRAVSLGEMADIVEKGAVSGGGNGFHGFDNRPFVFFSDAITPKVIWQGEEIERSLGHSMQLQFKELWAALDGYMEEMEYEARRNLQGAFRTMNEEVLLKLSMLDGPLDWDEIRDPRSKSFRDAVRIGIVPVHESDGMLREFTAAGQAIKDEFKAGYRQRYEECLREREAMSFTSALIETHPIGLGFHFSEKFGRSGMGKEDEYGLFPGQVRAEHVKCVLWVKDGIVVDETSLDAAPEVLERLGHERASARSAEGESLPCP